MLPSAAQIQSQELQLSGHCGICRWLQWQVERYCKNHSLGEIREERQYLSIGATSLLYLLEGFSVYLLFSLVTYSAVVVKNLPQPSNKNLWSLCPPSRPLDLRRMQDAAGWLLSLCKDCWQSARVNYLWTTLVYFPFPAEVFCFLITENFKASSSQ